MTEPITEGWVTTGEGEALTGYSRAYMRQLARRGVVKARKVGRDWLIDQESLLAYKAQMDRLGHQKHNPWRDDLTAEERGRQGGGTERTD
jgi:hypothetical protein